MMYVKYEGVRTRRSFSATETSDEEGERMRRSERRDKGSVLMSSRWNLQAV